MSDQEKTDAKDVEYFSAIANAWVNTSIEHDKSLLTLSAGGIGLLITLLSTVGIKTTGILVLYSLALLAFLICLGAVLWIFKRNAKHLEEVIKNDEKSDPLLATLDKISLWAFVIGVLFSSIIGLLTAGYSFNEKEKCMSIDNKKSTTSITADSVNGISNIRESFDGITRVSPNASGVAAASVNGISSLMPQHMAKSLNGIGGLNPKPSGATTSQTVATTPSAAAGAGAADKK